MLRVKIVCTIGPASRDPATLEALIHAGMDVARLNMSHGDPAFHRENIRRIRQISERLGKPVAILADLQGPKLRVGIMPPEGVPLTAGETLILTTEPMVGGPGRVPVQYEHLPEAVRSGDRILIDDGLLELKVINVEGSEIETQVVTDGLLTSNKGLNLPHAALSIPAITDKDRENLKFALEEQVDWIALSFVRTAEEVLDLKDMVRELTALGRPTPVIAKIEKPEAVDNIDAIIAAADGIMVARGDLGIEMSTEAVPMIQKTHHPQVQPGRQAGDHGHADAGLDDPQPAAHACRGQRCGQRHPGWHRRDHALGRDRGGQVSGAGRGNDGAHRQRDGGRAGRAAHATDPRDPRTHLCRSSGARLGRHRHRSQRGRHRRADRIRRHGAHHRAFPAALPHRRRDAQPDHPAPVDAGMGRLPDPGAARRTTTDQVLDRRILIDDGLLELKVINVEGSEIETQVVMDGLLTSNKGLNLPHAALSIPAITDKDRENLKFALEEQVDWIAISFVRTAEEVLELKDMVRELTALGRPTPVIAKIEKPEAVDNIDAIIAAADGIMVARGDLGIEMSTEAVPMIQKRIIHKCNLAGKPVITATQMLDSMIRNPRPTRAEASDVANAILDGTDAIMLSGETAAGKYPALAVETMARHRQRDGGRTGRPAHAADPRDPRTHLCRSGGACLGRHRHRSQRGRHRRADGVGGHGAAPSRASGRSARSWP